jgi:predicted dehydrogenase
MTEAAAAAGKHVICTKPLTAYVGQDLGADAPEEAVGERDRETMLAVAVADAEAMLAATRAAGVRLFYAENWLFAPSIVRARELLAAAGGRVLEMRGHESHSGSHSPYSRSWRATGGGALLRLGAHPIGAMLAIKREEGMLRDGRAIRPVAVTAETADLTRVAGLEARNTHVATGWKDVESWGTCVIAFEDGSRATAFGSDVMLGGMQSRLLVMSSNSHLDCRLSPSDALRAYASTEEVLGDQYLMEKLDSHAGWSAVMPDEDTSSGAVAMCEAFAHAIAEQAPCAADGELGAGVVRVLYSAYVSAAQGRRVLLD